MKHLDCRGLACPGPVIQVKKALEELTQGGSFSLQLDSEASLDNVLRFAGSKGAQVQVSGKEDGVIGLVITAPEPTETENRRIGESERKPPVVLITSETLGSGDDKLGRILMEGFINTLLEQDRVPDRIILLNGGVKLAAEGSEVLDTLTKLADLGCEVNACGTCLEFFSLKERLAVGTVSNMFDIQKNLLEADPVIKI